MSNNIYLVTSKFDDGEAEYSVDSAIVVANNGKRARELAGPGYSNADVRQIGWAVDTLKDEVLSFTADNQDDLPCDDEEIIIHKTAALGPTEIDPAGE
jgi:hypothetical protein